MLGSPRRVARIAAADGRSLIVAFDHGAGGANYGGMARPGQTLDEVIAAGADAVLTTVGIAEAYSAKLNRVGLILNMDLASGCEEAAVREVLAVGGEMGKFIMTPWNPDARDSIARARHLASVCHEWGLPLMVEPIPVSFGSVGDHTPEKIGKAARIACEIGADVVKMQYPGNGPAFEDTLQTLYRPVVILGGPERNNDRGVLQDIREAMDAGAIGVAIGRNIWNRERPAHMVAALASIIHGGASVDSAMRELDGVVALSR
jgi:DhnA family fructose-bisphosphate aldolase class Ia